MGHPVKHTYKVGSPGAKRAWWGTTLTAIKKEIARASDRSAARRKYRQDGLIA